MPTENPASILYDAQGRPLGMTTDAFGRVRVSQPTTIFDSKQLFDQAPLLFTKSEENNGALEPHDVDRASSLLTVTAEAGSRALRQTKRYFNYQPGKSQLVNVTFVMGTAAAGVVQSVGLFDDDNGLFFRMNGTQAQVVRRSHVTGSPIDTAIDQANWNVDKLDGTGRSGITLDPSKALILIVDYEWLGTGIARIGFIIGGRAYYVHEFKHSNIISSVYMSTPNLPIRWEITSDGSNAGSLETICCSVISEGGFEPTGILCTATNGIVSKTGDTGLPVPLLQIRLKDGYKSASVFMWNINILGVTKANSAWYLYLNPTKNGVGTSPSWVGIANSAIEYDVAETNRVTGGTMLASGHFSELAQAASNLRSLVLPGVEYDGTKDVLCLAVNTIGGGGESYLGSMQWLEAA